MKLLPLIALAIAITIPTAALAAQPTDVNQVAYCKINNNSEQLGSDPIK